MRGPGTARTGLSRLFGNRSRPTLDAIGLRNKIDQSSDRHDYLGHYAAALQDVQVRRIALLSGRMTIRTANTFAEYFPDALVDAYVLRPEGDAADHHARETVRVVPDSSIDSLHVELSARGPYDLIIDDSHSTKAVKRELFRSLFFHTADGGIFASEDLHQSHLGDNEDDDGPDVGETVSRLAFYRTRSTDERKAFSIEDRALAIAIAKVTLLGRLMFVHKTGTHYPKIRDADIEQVLGARVGESWGRTLDRIGGMEFVSRATVDSNRPELSEERFPRSMTVPDMSLRAYEQVACYRSQICLSDGIVLPDTFRHHLAERLSNRFLVNSSPLFGQIRKRDHNQAPQALPGVYYYLDSEHPEHYGHFLTEVLSRLWGLARARAEYPDLKILVSLERSEQLPTYLADALRALGYDESSIVIVDAPVLVDTLICATPLFHNWSYVNPVIEETWDELREAFGSGDESGPKRIFVARPEGSWRPCHNSAEVMEIFTRHGFTVINPEEHSLATQVDLFASAEAVAGWAGTALFNALYARQPGLRIVIASESYDANNEYLISSVKGDNMHYFWCEPDVPQADQWDLSSFLSGFTFDLEHDREPLEKLLDSLD